MTMKDLTQTEIVEAFSKPNPEVKHIELIINPGIDPNKVIVMCGTKSKEIFFKGKPEIQEVGIIENEYDELSKRLDNLEERIKKLETK